MFEQSGKFVTEKIIAPATLSSGSAFVPVLSKDPQQQWLYLADGTNHKVWILRRSTMEVVGEFGRGGRQLGQFLRPHGMSIDSKGNLYVGEASTGRRVQRFLVTAAALIERRPHMARRSPHRRPGRRAGGARRRRARAGDPPPYCAVETAGAEVEVMRPAAGEPPLDDVNWFARPVPNPKGHWIVAVASHNLNYLYNLTTGVRVRIPDKSDAVATPDGRYITVPSHYTAANTVNFYDAADAARAARGRARRRRRAAGLRAPPRRCPRRLLPVGGRGLAHDQRRPRDDRLPDDVLGLDHAQDARLPHRRLHVHARATARLTVTPTVPMRLCPQITRDLATPFISKDGRYVVAHDDSVARPARIAQDLRDHRHRSGRRRPPRVQCAPTSASPPARPTSASTAAS